MRRRSSRFGGGRPRVVTALLNEHLFGAHHFRELVAEPLAGVDGVQLDVAERVAGHFLALGLQFRHDGFHTGAFRDEDVRIVIAIHDFSQPIRLRRQVDLHFRDVDAVDLETASGQADCRQPFLGDPGAHDKLWPWPPSASRNSGP